ncbi:hypothetical protein XENOCAPTIV_004836 [Xenoophorus captivus]|uniref:AGC-kinase C-terminal domain-containing protein n=1 Tax=Xenoophorus captivus TaxID=1517983 RepID=A0ABV0QKC8_9TELE
MIAHETLQRSYDEMSEMMLSVIMLAAVAELDIYLSCVSFRNDPKERLGCHPQTGFADINGHPFFRNVDWDLLEQKQVVPPFKPNISGEFGLDNFDAQFTNEPIQLTPDDEDIVRKIDQSEFEGFEYINPLLMSAEECV